MEDCSKTLWLAERVLAEPTKRVSRACARRRAAGGQDGDGRPPEPAAVLSARRSRSRIVDPGYGGASWCDVAWPARETHGRRAQAARGRQEARRASRRCSTRRWTRRSARRTRCQGRGLRVGRLPLHMGPQQQEGPRRRRVRLRHDHARLRARATSACRPCRPGRRPAARARAAASPTRRRALRARVSKSRASCNCTITCSRIRAFRARSWSWGVPSSSQEALHSPPASYQQRLADALAKACATTSPKSGSQRR